MGDDSVQSKGEAEANTCDHIGHYQGFGFESIPMPDGSVIGVTALCCTNCGMMFFPRTPIISIEAPEKPKSAILKN